MRQRLSRSMTMLLVVAGILMSAAQLGCVEQDYCARYPSHCQELAEIDIPAKG